MDWSGATIPAQEPEPSPPGPRVTKKVWIILGAVLVLVVVSAAGWKILENNRARSRVVPELIRETTTGARSFEEGHPELFFADLELNPKTGLVTQHQTKRIRGDMPALFLSPPPATPSEFVYKVEVLSEGNEVFQSAWGSIPKEIITTPAGTLRLNIVTIYKPQAFVRISIPSGQVVWTGKIQ